MTINDDNLHEECLYLLKKIRLAGKICCMDIQHWYHRNDAEIEYTISIFNSDGIRVKTFHDLAETRDYLLEFVPDAKGKLENKIRNKNQMFERI